MLLSQSFYSKSDDILTIKSIIHFQIAKILKNKQNKGRPREWLLSSSTSLLYSRAEYSIQLILGIFVLTDDVLENTRKHIASRKLMLVLIIISPR